MLLLYRNTDYSILKMRSERSRQWFALSCALLVLLPQVSLAEDDAKAKKDSVGTVVGIDLGTTYSV